MQVGFEGADQEGVLLGSEKGLMTRITLGNVPVYKGIAAKGVRLIRLQDGDVLTTVTPLRQAKDEDTK